MENAKETTNVNIRMDKEVKEQAEKVFKEMGMNMTTAINIFVRQTLRQGKIPFEIAVDVPNAVTLEAMQEAEDMISGKIPRQTQDIDDLFEELGIDVTD